MLAPWTLTSTDTSPRGLYQRALWRERDAERRARIRSEERTEIAAQVHDSVLQTLALIQQDPADPRRVASLGAHRAAAPGGQIVSRQVV